MGLTIPQLLTGCALEQGISSAGNLSEVDVIPARWVTHDGHLPHSYSASENAYVFPAGKRDGCPVNYHHDDLLEDRNALPCELEFAFDCVGWFGSRCRSKIVVKRKKDPKGVYFEVDNDSLNAIRSLRWSDFQALQCDFNRWLLDAGKPRSLGDAFKPGRKWFTPKYEEAITAFWGKCLAMSALAETLPPSKRWPPNRTRIRDNKPQDFGPYMGAVPLEPGMRLVIHWGGTAAYPLGKKYISRQTITGESRVDVVYRNRGVALNTLRHVPREPWRLDSVRPHEVRDVDDYLPFGKSEEEMGYAGIVAVYNELDLLHTDVLSRRPPTADSAPPRYLTLLVPVEYIKSDLARKSAGRTSNSSANTIEAIDETAPANPPMHTMARRYIIWASDARFEPLKSAPTLDDSSHPSAVINDASKWPFTPLIFGNQTSVSIDLPCRLNNGPTAYVPMGTSWRDVVDVHARRVFAHADPHSTAPVLMVVRSSQIDFADITGSSDERSYRTLKIRCFGDAGNYLHRLEVRAGDTAVSMGGSQ